MKLDKEKIISEILSIDFISPISAIFVTVQNPEYDMNTYSKELDDSHKDWDYCDDKAPIQWQEYDEFNNYYEEPKEHKEWRINHNKKFKTMKVMMCVTPKKICDEIYKIDEKSLNKIVDELNSYTVYSISIDFNSLYQ